VKIGNNIHHISVGVVLLALEEKDLPGVAYRVVEQMVVDELIEPEEKPTVMRALLLKHRHVNEHDRFRFGMRRTFSSYTSLQVSYLGYCSTLMGHIPCYLMY
jgi:solute carrier family 4 anion exchanger 2